jgi:cytochrome c peroxidase
LLEETWTKKKWDGPEQFENKSGDLMMLPADLCFVKDAKFRKWVEIYAKDEERFFKDFSRAYEKLLELGVRFPNSGMFNTLFGRLFRMFGN